MVAFAKFTDTNFTSSIFDRLFSILDAHDAQSKLFNLYFFISTLYLVLKSEYLYVDKLPRFYSFFIHHKNNEKHSATKLQSFTFQILITS